MSSEALVTATHYWASQTVSTCESATRFDVTATVNTTPAAPTGTAAQSFCSSTSPTVANLAATGTAIKWYAASTGGIAKLSSEALVTATHYWASQTVSTCESATRFDVTVTVNTTPAAPTGTASQSFCSSTLPTVANLAATGTAVKWYAASTGGTAKLSSESLVTATHYWASQTVSTCESATRFDVTVTINNSPAISIQPVAPTAFCAGSGTATISVTATGAGLTYQWQKGGVNISAAPYSNFTTSTLTITNPGIGENTASITCIVSGTCTPPVTSSPVVITVNALPAITGQPVAPAPFCAGTGAATISVTATGAGLTYQWKKGGINISAAPYSNYNTSTLTITNPGIGENAANITCIVSGTCTPPVTSNVVEILINSVSGGTIASAQTICSGGNPAAFTESAASTGAGSLTYQWMQSANGYSASLGSTPTYDAPSGLTITNTYRRITTSSLYSVTCTANSNDIIVSVNSVTGGTIAAPQTICSGGNPVAFTESVASTGSGSLTYQWKQSSDGYSVPIPTANTATYDAPSGLTATNTYRRITTSTSGIVSCTANSNDVTVSINSVTGGTIDASQTIVSGGNPANLTFSIASSGLGTLSYQWQSGTDGSSFPTNLGTNTPSYDPPAGLTTTTYYRCITTSTLNGVICSAISNFITVTINSITPGTIAAAQTICSGGDPANLTFTALPAGGGTLAYQWQTGTDISFSSPTNVGTDLNSYNPPGGLTTTTYYRCVITSTLNSVVGTATSNVITVTVNAVASGTITSAQTICSGGDPANLTFSAASTGAGTLSYQWQTATDVSFSSPANVGTNLNSYNPPTGLTTTTYYRCITTSTLNTVVCTATSNVIIVTINAVTPGIIAAAQTICSGGDPADLTFSLPSTGPGTLSYQWQTATDVSFSSPVNVGTDLNSYNPPTGLTTTTYYRCITTSTLNTVVCSATSNVIIVTINAVTPGTIAAAQTICSGGDPANLTFTVPSTGAGTLFYQWQTATDVSFSSPTNVGTDLNSYNPPTGLTTTTYYRCITTSTLNTVVCSATSNVIIVTINAVTPGTITAPQTLCNGGDPAILTFSVASSGDGTLSYQWQSGTDGISFPTTVGINSNSFDPPSGLTVTTHFRCITTSTLNSIACTAISNDITVTVNDPVTGGTITAAQTICSGGDPSNLSFSIASIGSGTLSYEWQSSTDGNTFSTITGANSTSYNPPSGLTETTYYRCVTTSSQYSACNANSNMIIVTVNKVTGGTITQDQTLCNGGDAANLSFSVPSTGDGSLSYQWQSGTNGSAFPNNIGSGTSYNPPAGLTTTTYYRCITTSSLNGIICSAISNMITVTVNVAVTGGTIISSQTICNSGDPGIMSFFAASTGGGTFSYQWQTSIDGSNFPTNVGTNSNTYDPPSGLTANTYYRCVTTNTQNSLACTATSNVISVTINDVASGTITTNQTICNAGDPSILTFSSTSAGTGTLSYQWQSGTDGINFATNVGTNSTSYDPPSGLTNTTYYRCVTSSILNSVTCTAISNYIIITVQNAVNGGTIASAQTICSGGDPSNLTFSQASSGSGTLTYQWQSGTNGTTFPNNLGTGASYNPSMGLTNTTYYRCITTSTLNNVTCQSNSNMITVTINAIAGGTINPAQTICSGGDPTDLIFSSSSTGAGTLTYQWQSGTDGLAFPTYIGTGTNTYNPPSGLLTTTYYRCVTTSTLNGITCLANSNSVSVTVNSVSAGVIGTAQTICSGEDPAAFIEITPSTSSGSLTYVWKKNTDAYTTTLATSSIYDVPSGLSTTTTYRRITTGTLGGVLCTSTSNDVTVTVNPLPIEPNFTPYSTTVCPGSQSISFTLDSVQNGVSYSWSATNATLAASWGGTPNAVFNFGTISPAIITLLVTNTQTGCTNIHSETINVSGAQAPTPPPISIINTNWLVCQLNGSGISYQWGYDSIPSLSSHEINGAVFQQYQATDYPTPSKEYWVIVKEGDCFSKSYLNEHFLSIDDYSGEQLINLYPNPARESLNVHCSENIISFQVVEITGQLAIERQNISAKKSLTIDLKELNNGIYLIEFETVAHNKVLKKLIIRN